MKKLFYLLFAVAMFTACGSDDPVIPDPTPNPNPTPTEWNGDWNSSSDPNYKKEGYNPIYGKWIVTKRNGAAVSDFMVYNFGTTISFGDATSPYLTIATTKPAEGKAPTYGNSQKYIINDKAYKIGNTIYKYTLVSLTSLTIVDGSTTITLIPYNNNDVWYWKGDWNDPADPHYAIYKGKYNPIVGTWKLVKIGNDVVLPGNVSYRRFNADFTVENPSYTESGGKSDRRKYWINDTGIMEDSYKLESIFPSNNYSYSIAGNTLYYQSMPASQSYGIATYERYK